MSIHDKIEPRENPVEVASDLILDQGKTINEAVSIAAESYPGDAIDIRMNIPEEIMKRAPKYDRETRIITDISIDKRRYKLIAIIFSDHNECCCESRCTPYLLTKSRLSDMDIYSCQCACGGWCTNGHEHPEEAIREYESMCKAENKRRRERGYE